MSKYVYQNFVETSLVAAVGAASASIEVASLSGLTLGANEMAMLTLMSGSQRELVEVTAISGNVLTVVRGKEGTTAQAFGVGAKVVQSITAGQFEAKADVIEPWHEALSASIDLNNGRYQYLNMTANASLSIANMQSNGDMLVLEVKANSYTLTLPAVDWFGGSLVWDPAKTHLFCFWTRLGVLCGQWEYKA